MTEQWLTLQQLFLNLGALLVALLQFALHWALVIAWLTWWLFGVDWTKTREVLAQGAWAPVVLVMIATALAWSQLAPSELLLGGITVRNFWWQLGAVGLIAAGTLLCGWLQEVLGLTPPHIELEPPVAAAGQEHHHH